MSSPIKLKFWCNEHRFVEAGFGAPITELHFNQHGELGLACPLCYKSRPMTIVRYTGLKDKIGTEIFEGDIVSCHDIGPNEEIFFFDGAFRLGSGLMINNFTTPLKLRVIGNIYETPELLEPTS